MTHKVVTRKVVTHKGRIKDILWPPRGHLLVIMRMLKGRLVASLALSYNVASLALVTMLHRWP